MGFTIGAEDAPRRKSKKKGEQVKSIADIELFHSGAGGKDNDRDIFVLYEGFESLQARSAPPPARKSEAAEQAHADRAAVAADKPKSFFAVRWIPADASMFELDEKPKPQGNPADQ